MRISDWSSDVCSSDLKRPSISSGLWLRIIDDCNICNRECLFRSCTIHCAVQYHPCLLGILSQKLSRVALGRPFFSTFLVERQGEAANRARTGAHQPARASEIGSAHV